MALLARRWLECRIFTKALKPAGAVLAGSSDAESVSFTVEWNGVGTGSVTLPANHKLVEVLLQPGIRLQFRYRNDVPPMVVEQMSGAVVASVMGLGSKGPVVTFTAISDDILLSCLAWPNPTQLISNQTSEYDTRTGKVDQMVYELVRDNLTTRLTLPVVAVPDVWAGPTVTLKARMQPMGDVVRPALEETGRGLRLYQWNPGDVMPFFLPTLSTPCVLAEVTTAQDRPYVTWSTTLGITSGVASTGAPTATRVIVGRDGEGVLRNWSQKVDLVREADWGALGTREVFVDARDATDATTTDRRATEALDAGAPKAGLSAQTVDGEPWTLGTHYRLGDRTRIAAGGEVISTEVVRAITITHTAKEGLLVTPQIGNPSSAAAPNAALARTLTSLGARITGLETRR